MEAAPLNSEFSNPYPRLTSVLSVPVQGSRGENNRVHLYCTCPEPPEGPSRESVLLPGLTDFQNSEAPLTTTVINGCYTLAGGVSCAVRTAIRCCSACVALGDAHKTGKDASSTRFETGIQCFTYPNEARYHQLMLITKQALITVCDLAWLRPFCGGMCSTLT